jgi:DNA-binding transcriptional ArsR family regulator
MDEEGQEWKLGRGVRASADRGREPDEQGGESVMSTPKEGRTTPPRLPEALRPESTMVKLIWAYLLDQGVVSYSTRAIAQATGSSQPAVSAALNRLREIGLLKDLTLPQSRVKPTFQVLEEA